MDNVSPREAVGSPPIRERGAVSHRVVRGYGGKGLKLADVLLALERHRAITSGPPGLPPPPPASAGIRHTAAGASGPELVGANRLVKKTCKTKKAPPAQCISIRLERGERCGAPEILLTSKLVPHKPQ
eukprot:scaffold12087_cov135-Isochrysis_galbana.AAC.1